MSIPNAKRQASEIARYLSPRLYGRTVSHSELRELVAKALGKTADAFQVDMLTKMVGAHFAARPSQKVGYYR